MATYRAWGVDCSGSVHGRLEGDIHPTDEVALGSRLVGTHTSVSPCASTTFLLSVRI